MGECLQGGCTSTSLYYAYSVYFTLNANPTLPASIWQQVTFTDKLLIGNTLSFLCLLSEHLTNFEKMVYQIRDQYQRADPIASSFSELLD